MDLIHMGRVENVVEDKIVHCRTMQLTQGENRKKPTIIQNSSNNKKDLVSQSKVVKFENSELVKIETTQIISRNISHDIDLIDFVSIVPHHIQDKSEIIHLSNVSEQRQKFQCSILGQDNSVLKRDQSQIKTILRGQDNQILMSDASLIDKILRIGKEEQIHIISLSLGDYNTVDNELKNQAIELGANIYTIQYPQKPKHKFDLIYAAIAAVNKLLDDSVHPDKILIQCDGSSYGIIKVMLSQFAKRGIALSEVIIADNGFDITSVENNHRCLLVHSQTYKVKLSTKYDGAFKGFFKHLAKCFKTSMIQRLHLSAEISTKYTVTQLISLFIKCNQLFLKENVKSRNPNLPNDKVDNIIGILPDEV